MFAQICLFIDAAAAEWQLLNVTEKLKQKYRSHHTNIDLQPIPILVLALAVVVFRSAHPYYSALVLSLSNSQVLQSNSVLWPIFSFRAFDLSLKSKV